MNKTSYQKPEIRNSNDEIIQSGAYGKNTALSNPQNTGVVDYINNNLEWLNDNKANSNSPVFAGNPTCPTADVKSLNTQIANTAFVRNRVRHRIITGLSSLGISGNCTLNDVFKVMVNEWTEDTEAWVGQGVLTSGITDLPLGYGLLHIGRVDGSRYYAEYICDGGKQVYQIVDNASIQNRTVNDLVLKETLIASGDNYVRYTSGLQICWGTVALSKACPANNGITDVVTYSQAFSAVGQVVASFVGNSANAVYGTLGLGVQNIANNNFTVAIRNGSSAQITPSIRYIAIGRWK